MVKPANKVVGPGPTSRPLTAAEISAIARAEADVRAGRTRDHDEVAARLRQRAEEIVKRVVLPVKSR